MIDEKKCPDCGGILVPKRDGTWKCPDCHAIFVPKDCTGIFIPLSIIGIN